MTTAISGQMLQMATIARDLPSFPKATGAAAQMNIATPEIIPAPGLADTQETPPRPEPYVGYIEKNRMPVAMLVSVGLHGLAAAAMLVNWSFRSNDESPPPAAMVVELAVMPASPPEPPNEMPPGPEQVEAAPMPKPLDRMKFDPPPQVDPTLRPNFALPVKQEVRPQDTRVVAKEARETTSPPSIAAPPRDKTEAPVEGSNSAPPSDAEQGWLARIVAKMARAKRYPAQARDSGQQDMVFVRLTLDRQGRLVGAALKKSAGFQLLDAETLALAKRASPFPAPPKTMTGDRVNVTVPVEFKIVARR